MSDLRLVPAAVLTWLACALGVGWPARTLLVVAGGLAAVAGIIVVLVRRGPPGRGRSTATAWLALVAAGVALASCAAQVHLREEGLLPALVADRATVTVVGAVRSEPTPLANPWPDSDPRIRFVVALEQVTGRGSRGDAAAPVLVLADAQDVPYGARVQVWGRLEPAGPGDDVAAVLRASRPVSVVSDAGAVDAVVGRVRSALLRVTDPLPADQRGLVPGAAIGDTTRMPADLDQAMRDVSLTHITAVSGGHFAVLSLTVLAITAVLRLPGWARAVVTGVAMTGFVLLVHPDPSVVRAAAMGAVAVLGMLLGRPSRAIPALGTAVVVLLVIDPWLARSFGFVLSALATGALALLAPMIAARLTMVPRWFAVAVSVPIAAQAVCGPVLVLLDPSVSMYAVPANLLAAPALLPATVLGVAAAVTAPWAPGLAGVLAHGAGAATWWIAVVARTCAGLPGARHDWPSGPVGALALVVATGVVLAIPPALRRWGLRAGVVVVLVAVATFLPGAHHLLHAWPPRDWRVVACDVGQGDALVVRSGPGAAVVVDVGPDGPDAAACLDRLGITRIDLLVLTHHHADHVGGLDEVLGGREVVQALVSPLAEPADQAWYTRSALEAAGVPIVVGAAQGLGSAGRAGEVTWTVLSPASVGSVTRSTEPTGSQINDSSLVVLLQAPDLTVLTLGDAEPVVQERLAALLVRAPPAWAADVVKVAHHGSVYQSDRLIGLLAPPVAVISVGAGNDYGHPADRTVGRFEAAGSLVLRTDECGPVAVGRAGSGSGLVVSAQCLQGARRDP